MAVLGVIASVCLPAILARPRMKTNLISAMKPGLHQDSDLGQLLMQNVAGNILNTYFARNNASSSGGAVYRATSSGDIKGCSFYGNYAVSDGGAIYDSHVSVSLCGVYSRACL